MIEHNTDGSKTDFYDIGNCKDVDDLCHHWNMNFFEGNILKALVGMAKGRKGNVRHSGTSYERDLNKAKHYIDKLIKIKKGRQMSLVDDLILIEETGMKYPKAGSNSRKYKYGLYKCYCGNTFETKINSVMSGNTKSCGCRKAVASGRKHGMRYSRIYKTWTNMKSRCNNKNASYYEIYGGRGISVCKEWSKFETFYEWAKITGYNDTLEIDRINPDGNYEPSNCRWVNELVQARNTILRKKTQCKYRGVTKDRDSFRARITVNNKSIYIGNYKTEEDAAIAYDAYVFLHNLEHTPNRGLERVKI